VEIPVEKEEEIIQGNVIGDIANFIFSNTKQVYSESDFEIIESQEEIEESISVKTPSEKEPEFEEKIVT